jgi:hypothetical protein
MTAALVVPSAASAKTYKVNMKTPSPGTTKGTAISGTLTGTPFGTCKMKGTLIIPKATETWKCKGGSFRLVAVSTTGANNNVKGTWTLSKGTGKFKGIKGRGTFTGKLSTGLYTYKGKASY